MTYDNNNIITIYVFFFCAGFTHVHTPQFARGNLFANQPTQHQLHEQDTYKACLKQQVLLQTGGAALPSITSAAS